MKTASSHNVIAAIATPSAIRAALRILERDEQEYEAKLAALRAAIDEGDASRIAERNPFARIRRRLKSSKKKR